MNITLEKYIPELLFNLECLIIPDFGGFVTRTETAAFDEQNMSFRPPFRSISFNKNLVINDGSLIHHVMNTEKITYEQASIAIKYAVAKWNSTLIEKKRLEINGIGVFSLFTDQTIQFEPKIDVNFLIESFGLFPITVRPVNAEKTEGIIDLYSKANICSNTNTNTNANIPLMMYMRIYWDKYNLCLEVQDYVGAKECLEKCIGMEYKIVEFESDNLKMLKNHLAYLGKKHD